MNSIDEQFCYEFGPFRADPLKRQLFLNCKPVPLTAKAFDTLMKLVNHNGETVLKDELMNSVWQGVAVEENNLTQQISTLRKALQEKAGDHKYIVTIPGKGYCFIAPVRITETLAASETVIDEVTSSSLTIDISEDVFAKFSVKNGSQFGFWPSVAVTTIILTLGLSIFWVYLRRAVSDTRPQTLAVLPFRSIDGYNGFFGAGMSDTLTAKLGNLQELNVVMTNPAGIAAVEDPLAAGRELHVDTVLDGTIQREGEQIRVNVKMLDVATGKILWGESFDRRSSDIFAVQDSISDIVASVLRTRLRGEPAIYRYSGANANRTLLSQ